MRDFFVNGEMPERFSEMLKELFRTNFFYEADGKGGGAADSSKTDPSGGGAGSTEPDPTDQPETFDTWLEAQPEDVKTKVAELYNKNVSGLKSALQSERDEKKGLSTQLKELLPKAEKGSELEKQLTEMANKAESAERRALFAEEAIQPEIGCRNIKAAYAIAIAEELFDKRGNPEWERIKTAAPELFGTANANANAGAGTNRNQPVKKDMNAFIREATGRQ